MAHPRRVVPNETYLITRRCYQRTLRLRPSRETKEIFIYCLALAMQKTGVVLHAACVMSNHHHLVVTDPLGQLPNFLRELHRLTAKALNASQGQWENLWAAEPCNAVRLVTDEDVLDKIAYVAANPVAAGLVHAPDDWPGLAVWRAMTLRTSRPKAYFRDDGVCPAEAVLVVSEPPARNGEATAIRSWSTRLADAIEEKVRAAHKTLRAAGRVPLGARAVMAASFSERASSHEAKRGTVPTFASMLSSVRDHLRRVEKHFRAQYRAALERWCAGLRGVAFPVGTWGMRVAHGALVEAADA